MINAENTVPIPAPTPANAIVAKPAPTNFAACNLLGLDWQDQDNYSMKDIEHAEKILRDRMKTLESGVCSKLLEQYANPVIKKLQ